MGPKDCKSYRKLIPLSTIFREEVNFSSKVCPSSLQLNAFLCFVNQCLNTVTHTGIS